MKRLIASIATLSIVLGGATAQSQKPVRGTHVTLAPPPGFVATERFPGFMSEENGASIMVSELPGPFGEMTKGFNASGFKKQGMTLLTQEKASYGTYNGMLISVAQSAQGVDFLKWMAAFGDEKTTYLVTASFPKEAEADLSNILKKAVMGARVSAIEVDPFDALTFRVSPTNDMKIAKVIGNSMILSKGGAFPAKSSETPVFLVSASVTKGLAIPNKKVFAEARLQKMATLKDVRVQTTKPITIGGLDGFESVADALHSDNAAKVLAYQVILFDADGYYLMAGIAPEREGKAKLTTFKQMAGSFMKTEAEARR